MPSPPPQTRSPLCVSGAVFSGFSWAAGSSSRPLPSRAAEPEETCRPSGAPGAAMATGGTSPKIRSQLDCCQRTANGCGLPWKTGPIPRGALWGVGIGDCYGTSAIYGGADHREASGGGCAFIGVRFLEGRRSWRRRIGSRSLREVPLDSSNQGFSRGRPRRYNSSLTVPMLSKLTWLASKIKPSRPYASVVPPCGATLERRSGP
jgi:hypothetical protein